MTETFPESPRPRHAPSGSAVGARTGSGYRAMVVEDEPELAGLLGRSLERDGFEVAVFHDGAEAVTAAHSFDPDISATRSRARPRRGRSGRS